jgi:F-type H+-transporting ATPase subunit epsilon
MLTIEVISPEKVVTKRTGVEVIVPTTTGELGIRKGHRPLLAELKAGVVVVKDEHGKEESLATFGGVVEVFQDRISILADSAELAHEMNELEIEQAIARAQNLQGDVADAQTLRTASAMLGANLIRMKAIRRRKH